MTLDSLLFDGVDIQSLRGIQDDMSQFGYVGTVALARKNVETTSKTHIKLYLYFEGSLGQQAKPF